MMIIALFAAQAVIICLVSYAFGFRDGQEGYREKHYIPLYKEWLQIKKRLDYQIKPTN